MGGDARRERRPARAARPGVEPLEGRAPAASGWSSPLVTLSIVPDGTTWSGGRSTLQADLDRKRPGWRGELWRALSAFAEATGLAVAVVGDDGSPYGAPGRAQGDPRFGDIRLGGVAAEPTVLGWAVDPHPGNGTASGDVTLNVAQDWDTRDGTGFDLFSVALHELGHAFGLDHSDDPASVMTPAYGGVRAGLGAPDAAALRGLYRFGNDLGPGASPADVLSKFRMG